MKRGVHSDVIREAEHFRNSMEEMEAAMANTVGAKIWLDITIKCLLISKLCFYSACAARRSPNLKRNAVWLRRLKVMLHLIPRSSAPASWRSRNDFRLAYGKPLLITTFSLIIQHAMEICFPPSLLL